MVPGVERVLPPNSGATVRLQISRIVMCVLVAAACGPAVNSSGQGSANELVGRTFISTSVNEAGEPRSLVEGPLRVWFGQSGKKDRAKRAIL